MRLARLKKMSPAELAKQRYEKFRNIDRAVLSSIYGR